MKTHLIHFLFLVICSFTSNAQLQPLPIPIEQYYQNINKSTYFKDVNGHLNKFLGTWEYNENGHYFKIQFFKEINVSMQTPNSPIKSRQFCDLIYARFVYKQNGSIVYNTLNQTDISTKWFIRSTLGSIASNTNKIWLNYQEPSSNPCGRVISGSVDIEYSNAAGIEKLSWVRTDTHSYSSCMEYEISDHTPFQIPDNMTLKKID